MYETNIRRLQENSARYGPQDPRDNMVVNSLGFLLASFIPDLELKMLATQKHQQVRTKTNKQKKTPTTDCAFHPKHQERSSLAK